MDKSEITDVLATESATIVEKPVAKKKKAKKKAVTATSRQEYHFEQAPKKLTKAAQLLKEHLTPIRAASAGLAIVIKDGEVVDIILTSADSVEVLKNTL